MMTVETPVRPEHAEVVQQDRLVLICVPEEGDVFYYDVKGLAALTGNIFGYHPLDACETLYALHSDQLQLVCGFEHLFSASNIEGRRAGLNHYVAVRLKHQPAGELASMHPLFTSDGEIAFRSRFEWTKPFRANLERVARELRRLGWIPQVQLVN